MLISASGINGFIYEAYEPVLQSNSPHNTDYPDTTYGCQDQGTRAPHRLNCGCTVRIDYTIQANSSYIAYRLRTSWNTGM